jgi:pilus assembly protein CpaC
MVLRFPKHRGGPLHGGRLTFTPVVDGDEHITLTLTPEVSQVDFGNLANGLPSFTTRRASTTVELLDQQSIILAGLYQNNQSRNKSVVPLLSKLPVLGALFRDSQLRGNESEVMIIITPSLSFVTTQENLQLRQIENSAPSSSSSFFRRGQMEALANYSLQDMLDGTGITGPFGPMLTPKHDGILYGKN